MTAKLSALTFFLALSLSTTQAAEADRKVLHDEFFWLGQINKATAVINTDEGLLDKSMTPLVVKGIRKVLDDAALPGAKRPSNVITFEPLLIKAAGPQITLLHAGRSSQDMLATMRSAILREDMLDLADQLNRTTDALLKVATRERNTIVPNYTNGVAAQPNSYGHYLLGYAAALDRDAQRIREAYVRLDRSAMGTTVLNGSSWPLNRNRMAAYLGFATIVDNAYDAAQLSSVDEPIEAGAIITSIAIHAGVFVQDIMVQYAQPRPWILLKEGGENTYVSSAMPQKRNPGLLNSTRRDASAIVTAGIGTAIAAHNIPAGMSDPKDEKQNHAMMLATTAMLMKWEKILAALDINPQRALEELNSDWTASQELADVLMRKYKLPFRIGHHFASEVVEYAKTKDIRPLDFPYADAQRIYAETVRGTDFPSALPLSEEEFHSTLDPVAIVRNRATTGGPQPAEMSRMLREAGNRVAQQFDWINKHRAHISSSLRQLDEDFDRLGASGGVH